jgi:hypothetical protein
MAIKPEYMAGRGRGRGIQAKSRVYGLRSTDLSLPLMPRLHGHVYAAVALRGRRLRRRPREVRV